MSVKKATYLGSLNRSLNSVLMVLFPLFMFACSQDKEETVVTAPQSSSLELTLAVADKDRAFLAPLLDTLKNEQLTLGSGEETVKLTIQSLPLEELTSSLASGSLKSHLWISSSSKQIQYVNKNRQNLAATQSDCRLLLSDPIIFVTNRPLPENFFGNGLKDVQQYILSELKSGKMRMTLRPKRNQAGTDLPFIIQNELINDQIESNIANGFQAIEDDSFILERIAAAQSSDITELSLVSASSLLNYELTSPKLAERIVRYSIPYLPVDKIEICTSDAGWISAPLRVAAQKFVAIAEKFEFPNNYSILKTTNNEIFTVQNRSKKLSNATERWQEIRSPIALSLVLDTSGSMQDNDKFFSLKQIVLHLHSLLDSADRVALTTFSNAPVTILPFDYQRLPLSGELLYYLDKVREAGGSSPLDAIKTSAESLLFAPQTMRKITVLFVDGPDTHSRIQAQEIKDFIRRRSTNDNILFLAVGLESPDVVSSEEVPTEGDVYDIAKTMNEVGISLKILPSEKHEDIAKYIATFLR